jgi:hypothetical protein
MELDTKGLFRLLITAFFRLNSLYRSSKASSRTASGTCRGSWTALAATSAGSGESFRSRELELLLRSFSSWTRRLWSKLPYLFYAWFRGFKGNSLIGIAFSVRYLSPKKNPGLLSRSEIVALFNTLHRFSESLHSVEVRLSFFSCLFALLCTTRIEG